MLIKTSTDKYQVEFLEEDEENMWFAHGCELQKISDRRGAPVSYEFRTHRGARKTRYDWRRVLDLSDGAIESK
jgi:hypothetical protein